MGWHLTTSQTFTSLQDWFGNTLFFLNIKTKTNAAAFILYSKIEHFNRLSLLIIVLSTQTIMSKKEIHSKCILHKPTFHA